MKELEKIIKKEKGKKLIEDEGEVLRGMKVVEKWWSVK